MDTTFTGKQVLIGLPESGKSTFIGALWHVVESEEIPDTLKLHNLGTDREYIESLREAWLTQNKPERNKLDERHLVWMQLKQAGSDKIAEIVFPDLAGELFEQQWRERIWTNDYFHLITESSGLLVFVHADHQHLPRHLSDINREARNTGADIEQASFDLKQAPPQVKLVEVLQFIAEQCIRQQPIPVAVIVSAWDIVEEMPKILGDEKPSEYFAKRVPLLYQYLTANPEYFTTQVFGVSAQGGDLEQHRERLQKVEKQSCRIRVRQDDKVTSDITLPIKWLMENASI